MCHNFIKDWKQEPNDPALPGTTAAAGSVDKQGGHVADTLPLLMLVEVMWL